jgi:alpha-D-xyloside xylohydrolase
VRLSRQKAKMALLLLLLLLLLPVQATAALGCVVVRDKHNAQQDLKIEQWGENAVRVRAVPSGGSFRDDLVSALVPPTDGFAAAECGTVVLGAAGETVTSGNLQAIVGADGLLTFTRLSDNKVLLSEASVRGLTPTTTVPEREGFYAFNISFHATEGERIYGLGQHKTGLLDNVGGKFQLSPMNTEILIPVAHSSLGYAFLMNLPSFGSVELGKAAAPPAPCPSGSAKKCPSHPEKTFCPSIDDPHQCSTTGLTTWQLSTVLQADFWVATTAPDSEVETEEVSPWAQLQHAYANATGHAPVYPEWASGFWQCKNRYHNQSQVIDVARGYIDRGYPISLIIIDYFNWNPNPLGDETLPAACWPDPKGMVDELKQMGVELMISPYFHSLTEQSKYYAKALSEGFIVTNATGQPAKVAFADAYLYDLYNPAARAYAWEAVEAGYIAPYGLHHWWLDCDEPCGGDMTSLAYNNGTWPASFVGAAYPHMVDQMVFEGMGAADKQYTHDNVMLGRSAWAGSQRWGGAVWSGDTHSDFANLNQQFRAGLNLVMSGIPYW